MADNAAELLGEPIEDRAVVSARGTGKAVVTAGVARPAVLGAPKTPGERTGFMFVVLSASRMGFFTLRRGFLRDAPDRLILAVPRSDVVRFEVGDTGLLTKPVDVELRDGTVYELEVPRSRVGDVRKIERALKSD